MRDLSFSIPAGQCFGFLGVNGKLQDVAVAQHLASLCLILPPPFAVAHAGAGKTTTLKMLTAEILPTRGSATLGGYDLGKTPLEGVVFLVACRLTASVFGQPPSLMPCVDSSATARR